MYSYEINELLKLKNYLLAVEEYLYILETSPQIERCTYNAYDNGYYMKTTDDYEWNFRVRKGK